jgi:hypothetical protein
MIYSYHLFLGKLSNTTHRLKGSRTFYIEQSCVSTYFEAYEGRFTFSSKVSVLYQYHPFAVPDTCGWLYLICMWRYFSVLSVRFPTRKRLHVCFKYNHPHISGTLNGRYWYGTDTSLMSRPNKVTKLRGVVRCEQEEKSCKEMNFVSNTIIIISWYLRRAT